MHVYCYFKKYILLHVYLINAFKLERFNSRVSAASRHFLRPTVRIWRTQQWPERKLGVPFRPPLTEPTAVQFSLQGAWSGAIVTEQCMKALRLSIPAAACAYPLSPGVPL